ncbi:Hypothetical protein CAP_5084 [Chondromyces apiculatus DSM 436]|uniref:Uncharacterized protein n=1 Tax=Chondromyces apiculatus DSM 436 TaxID=1192034 RepID=A0A017T413_9BACT|nr:Hypothetical protein CAP_5084 [Chondromyces apiculatus DSM 436]
MRAAGRHRCHVRPSLSWLFLGASRVRGGACPPRSVRGVCWRSQPWNAALRRVVRP